MNSVSENLKPTSILVLVTLVFLASTIQDALSKETAKFVGNNESAHHGLPLEWNGDQVICVLYPPDHPHAEFNYGVTMIDSDGTTLGVNENYNGTGACIGGFEGYGEGLEFMMDATRAVGGRLAVGYEVGEGGPFVHTIGGLNANQVIGDFNGAYWSLGHNGEMSMVGIGDLVLSEGDVILWSIGTW